MKKISIVKVRKNIPHSASVQKSSLSLDTVEVKIFQNKNNKQFNLPVLKRNTSPRIIQDILANKDIVGLKFKITDIIQLHSGMYGRTVRREDREYMRDVKKRRGMSDTNLKTINKYLVNLAAYKNRSMSVAEAQVIDGGNGTEAPIVPEIFAPMAPKIKLTPKLQMRRQVRRGVGGY